MIDCMIIVLAFVVFIITFMCMANKNEKFITLSALNFAAASKARQLRYYDQIYGFSPRRWMRIYPQYQYAGLYGYTNRFQGSRDITTGKRIY